MARVVPIDASAPDATASCHYNLYYIADRKREHFAIIHMFYLLKARNEPILVGSADKSI